LVFRLFRISIPNKKPAHGAGSTGEYTIDVFLDPQDHAKFQEFVKSSGLDSGGAMVQTIKRGMDEYFLHEFKGMKEGFARLKDLAEDYRRDNELLKALEEENGRLRTLVARELGRRPHVQEGGKVD